jgi:hypothetical protein
MPHNFTGLDFKHDNFRKGFLIDPFDEPTYLTFAIDFKFEDTPSPNKEDMTNEVLLGNSPLFNQYGSNSASSFLLSRGYPDQAHGLTQFKQILKYLTLQAPWYFQSIDGLGEMYEQSTDQSAGYRTKDIKLTVSTLEAIDLRIFELATLYRNAIFDNKFRRERVPDNLRWFSMDIYIAEFRNIRYRLPGVAQEAAKIAGVDTGALGNIIGGGNALSTVMDQFGYTKFTCRQCEFDFSNSFPPGRNKIEVGADGRRQETNRFGIKVGWVEEYVKFADGSRIFDNWSTKSLGASIQNAYSFLTGLPIIGESIRDAGQKAAASLSTIGGLINPALQAASTFIDPQVRDLGDAYDIGYESNGDNPPDYPPEPNENVYN